MPSVSGSSGGGASLEIVVGSLQLGFGLYSQVLDSFSSIQSASDLFVGFHKLLKLDVEVSVLLLEHRDVLLESSNLRLHVRVSVEEAGVRESDFVKVLSGVEDLVVSASVLGVQFVHQSRKFSLLLEFNVSLSEKGSSLFTLSVALSLQRHVVPWESSAFVFESGKLKLGSLEDISSSSQVVLLWLGDLAQLCWSFLGLAVVEVNGSDSLRLVWVLPLSVVGQFSQPLDFINVLVLLLLELGHFVAEVINLLSNLVAVVGLVGQVSLGGGDFDFFPVDLVSVAGDLLLNIPVGSGLLVEEESQVIELLLEAESGHGVGLVLSSVVVILEKLWALGNGLYYLVVLEMSVLGLDVVELVSQG
jgi:hypothetical protein